MNLPIQSKFSIVAIASLFFFAGPVCLPGDSGSAIAKSKTSSKSKKSRKRAKKVSSKKRLVPPPPPYAPSILPELAYGRRSQVKAVEEEDKPVNPYAKYIYHRDEHKIPTPVRPNKYVSYWGNR